MIILKLSLLHKIELSGVESIKWFLVKIYKINTLNWYIYLDKEVNISLCNYYQKQIVYTIYIYFKSSEDKIKMHRITINLLY